MSMLLNKTKGTIKMKKHFKFIICFLFVFIASLCINTSSVHAEKTSGKTKTQIYVYNKANKKSDKKCKLPKNKKVTVIRKSKDKKWYYISFKIKQDGKNKTLKGYAKVSQIKKKTTGDDVVEYAKKFVGNPYVYGEQV